MNQTLTRMQRAVDYIETHLQEAISLEQVAQHTEVSRFVLHRTFRACMGESLKGYIRKRRLTEAATSLKDSDIRIIELAQESGFTSQEAFTRAFQGFFGCTPGTYRKDASSRIHPGMFPMSPRILRHHQFGIAHEPRIIERTEPHVVHGWGTAGDFEDDKEVIALWANTMAYLETCYSQGKSSKHPDDTFTGVFQPSHPDIPLGPEHSMAYVAGLAPPDWPEHTKDTIVANVPPGLYAVFQHKGAFHHLIHTVNYIWATWLPQSDYEKDERADLEIAPRSELQKPSPTIDLWIAIKPR